MVYFLKYQDEDLTIQIQTNLTYTFFLIDDMPYLYFHKPMTLSQILTTFQDIYPLPSHLTAYQISKYAKREEQWLYDIIKEYEISPIYWEVSNNEE